MISCIFVVLQQKSSTDLLTAIHRYVYKPLLFSIFFLIAAMQAYGAYKAGNLAVDSLPQQIKFRQRKAHLRDFKIIAMLLLVFTTVAGILNDMSLRKADGEQQQLKAGIQSTNEALVKGILPALVTQKQTQTNQIQSIGTPPKATLQLKEDRESLRQTNEAIDLLLKTITAQSKLLAGIKPSANQESSVVPHENNPPTSQKPDKLQQLSNIQLKQRAIGLAGTLRQMDNMYASNQQAIRDKWRDEAASHDQQWRNEHVTGSLDGPLKNNIIAASQDYGVHYETEAAGLRDEILRRMPEKTLRSFDMVELKRTFTTAGGYESDVTYSHDIGAVASRLELIAGRLSD
ncbi:MAG: hypothetical protein JST61_06345 [Acidobacteria bacterium]|nr:hypothetical protein [Acidobacteriota bacterium]